LVINPKTGELDFIDPNKTGVTEKPVASLQELEKRKKEEMSERFRFLSPSAQKKLKEIQNRPPDPYSGA
jgi:hypothetical protein